MFSLVEISIGQLPEWYSEVEHDSTLEILLENFFKAHTDQFKVSYHYSGASIISFWNNDDELVTRRETDLTRWFDMIKGENNG